MMKYASSLDIFPVEIVSRPRAIMTTPDKPVHAVALSI